MIVFLMDTMRSTIKEEADGYEDGICCMDGIYTLYLAMAVV